jgi:hypothetical protein
LGRRKPRPAANVGRMDAVLMRKARASGLCCLCVAQPAGQRCLRPTLAESIRTRKQKPACAGFVVVGAHRAAGQRCLRPTSFLPVPDQLYYWRCLRPKLAASAVFVAVATLLA